VAPAQKKDEYCKGLCNLGVLSISEVDTATNSKIAGLNLKRFNDDYMIFS
jgi:hypothetical protein